MTPLSSQPLVLLYRRRPKVQAILVVLMIVCWSIGMIVIFRATSPHPLRPWIAWTAWLGFVVVHALDRIVASNPRKVPANLHPNPDGTGPVIEIASASSRVVSFRRLPSLGVMRWILVPLFILLVGIDIGDGVHAQAVSMTMHDFWATQIGLSLFIGIQAVAALLIRPPDVVIIVREAKKRRRITAWLSRTQQS